MAAPWDYASKVYLDLKATLDDGTSVTLKIDRYLNNALKWKRNEDAGKAWVALVTKISTELKSKGYPPRNFTIDGVGYDLQKLQRVFLGKGAPEDIRNVVKLASHFKLTDAKKVSTYCNTNIGLDCNGFAGNFWGLDPGPSIDAYNVNRRKEVADVTAGDAMIFYYVNVAAPYHIAVVDEVIVHNKQIEIIVAQSMGPDEGIHQHSWGLMTPLKNKKGELYTNKAFKIGNTNMFFAEGPPKGKSAM